MQLRLVLVLAVMGCSSAPPGFRDAGLVSESGVPFGPSLAEALGATVQSDAPPPALAGGTLLVTVDGQWIVASDPDMDRIVVVDAAHGNVVGELALESHAEPGRAIEDGRGRVHVVLRRAGAIVTIDPRSPATPLGRRVVCPAPRGVAYDIANDQLHVACVGGELVTMPTDPGGAVTRTLHLADDLRDVVVAGPQLLVTRFRAGEVLVVELSSGSTHALALMPYAPRGLPVAARVAWRAVPTEEGALVLYQSEQTSEIALGVPAAYGAGVGPPECSEALVRPTLAIVEPGRAAPPTPIPCGQLAVDVAVAPDGVTVAVAVPGALPLMPCDQIRVHTLHPDQGGGRWVDLQRDERSCAPAGGRVVALAFGPTGVLWAQTRAPASVFQVGAATTTSLGGAARADTGFDAFHASSSTMLACASCHPEGGDDGQVWHFAGIGARRTMSVRGGVLRTAPFHWSGDLATFADLAHEVFARRMGGGELSASTEHALESWLDVQPQLPLPTVIDADAAERGRVLFESDSTECTTCHIDLSNEMNDDVGTGGAFQVPALQGLSYRAPYLHDGRAATLADRFRVGGGDMHGHTSQLDDAQIADLVAYLGTL